MSDAAARLLLEVGKRIVQLREIEVLTIVLSYTVVSCGSGVGLCKTYCAGCAKRRQKRQLGPGRQLRAEGPDKWLIREEVAERKAIHPPTRFIASLIQ